MSFIAVWFAGIPCLDPIKVVQLQLPLLLQSIQSVIANGKFSIHAKMFKATIPNRFLDTHKSVLTLWGKRNCWASLEVAFKKRGWFWVSGTGRAVFLSDCKPTSYCISYCITATRNAYFEFIFLFFFSLFPCCPFLLSHCFCHPLDFISVRPGLETARMLHLVHFCPSV